MLNSKIIYSDCNKKIHLKLINSPQNEYLNCIQKKISEWNCYWRFIPFNELLEMQLDVQFFKTNFIFILENHEKEIVSLFYIFFIELNLQTYSPSKILIRWIPNPEKKDFFKHDYNKFVNQILISETLNVLIDVKSIVPSKIAFFFFELPQNKLSISFTKNFAINYERYLNLKKSGIYNGEWVSCEYPCDELITNNDGQSFFRNTYHYFWYNPQFKSEIPKQIEHLFQIGLNLYQNYKESHNPFKEINDPISFNIFERILNEKKQYNIHSDYIKKKVKLIRYQRKLIWWRIGLFPPHNSKKFALLFATTMKKNMLLLHKHGFRIRLLKIGLEETNKFIQEHISTFIMNAFESIPTQGSMLSNLIDEKGNLVSDLFSVDYWNHIFSQYIALIEFQISNKEWIIAGWAEVKYKKLTPPYSKQLFSSLNFLERFRGASLAQILAMFGIFLFDTINFFDYVIEDGTEKNIQTTRLVNRLGFYNYGYIDRMIYDIESISKQSTANIKQPLVGIYRRYRLSQNCLKTIISSDLVQSNKELREVYSKNICLNDELFRELDELIEMGILPSMKKK